MNKKDNMKRMNLEQLIKVMNLINALNRVLEELNTEPRGSRVDESLNEIELIVVEVRQELIQAMMNTREWKEVEIMLRR